MKPDCSGEWNTERMLEMSILGGIKVSPDGKKVLFTLRSTIMEGKESRYLTHIFMTDVEKEITVPFTEGDKSCTSPDWSPDGKWISFLSDRNGKKNIWLISPSGGEAFPLTSLKSGVKYYEWSPDSSVIAFTMTDPYTPEEIRAKEEKRDVRVLDENIKGVNLYSVQVEAFPKTPRKPCQLTFETFSINSFDWSPDRGEIAFAHTKTPRMEDDNTSIISKLNIETGEVKRFINNGASVTSPLYSHDGKWLAFCSGENPPLEFGVKSIMIIPAKGGEIIPLSETPNQNPTIIGWWEDDKSLCLMECFRTTRRLYKLPTDGGSPQVVAGGETVLSTPSMNISGDIIAFKLNSSRTPEEIFIMGTNGETPRQITHINEKFKDIPAGKTETIRWKSTDGTEIEGLLTYPPNYSSGMKFPLLVEIHGGPDSLFLETYMGAFHYNFYPHPLFSQKGYLIFRPNFRGSDGYGADFRKLVMKDFGGNDIKDILSGVDFLVDSGIADPDRMGIMGWSYGGYLTAMIISQTNRFKAASFGAGLSNLVSLSTTTIRTTALPAYMGINLWEDFNRIFSHSPLKYAVNINTPLLILHGDADLMSPISQGLELYNTLRLMGKEVKMAVYPRSGHIIHEPKLCVDLLKRNLEWFEKYV